MKSRTTKILDYVGLIIDYFRKSRVGGASKGLDGYHYLNNTIQLWPGDWVKQMEKMNEAVGMKNCFTMDEVGKRSVCPFRRQECWKCIG